MTDELVQKIFKYFDENGIAGEHLGAISIEINLDKDSSKPYKTSQIFKPNLSQFGLNEEDTEQVIIDYIFFTTNIKISSVNELIGMRNIGDKPFVLLLNEHQPTKIKYCLAFGRIPGSFIVRDTDRIKTLGNIEEIVGDLGFSDSNLEDLGKLRRIEGSFWIAQGGKGIFTQLKSLQELEFVGGDVNIKNSNIDNLGKLKHVGGNLNIRQTFVNKFDNLEFVGGNLLLPKELKGSIDMSKFKVLGKIKFFNDRSLDDII